MGTAKRRLGPTKTWEIKAHAHKSSAPG